jgi:hypothetical protein
VTIRFVSGPLTGQTFSVGPGELFYIGADPACGAVVGGDPTVSAKHVCIYYRAPGKILIKDLGTGTGSRLNGRVLSRTSKLRAGDRVTVGATSTFQCSVWDPLQPSRMTMALRRGLSSMSRLSSRRIARERGQGPHAAGWLGGLLPDLSLDFAWRPGNRARTATAGVMGGLALALLVFTVTGVIERRAARDSSARIELRALTPVADVPAINGDSRAGREQAGRVDVDRNFIWDEIVNISVRFGETPPSAMDEKFIAKVQSWIGRFTHRGYHRELLRRRDSFRGPIEAALRQQNLPLELGYLVWIESAYETSALSPAGARGLWQLMPATAREYGLRVDLPRSVDERVDPARSSAAAAAYLSLLLRTFGTQRYLLAIASYNTGQNRVQRFQIATTIKRSRVADFWHLADQLPAETVDYVPKFLAAVIVARNPDRF